MRTPVRVSLAAIGLIASFVMIGAQPAHRAPMSQKGGVRSEMIVSTDWLAAHLKDPSLVLLQIGTKAEYDAEHIPGARFISTQDISTPRGQGLTLEIPPVDQLKTVFEGLGISDDSRIVVYFGSSWVTPAARVCFTLDYFGLGARTSMLDGGMPAWRAENRPVTAQLPEVRKGSLTPHLRKDLVVDAQWVSGNLKNTSVTIIDARNPEFYTGRSAGSMPRAGHIPGACNIPFDTVTDESLKFKSPEALRALFETAGPKPGASIVTYCHIGQQASLVYFVAKYLGYDAHLYDGSFQDWSAREELPVETSKPTSH